MFVFGALLIIGARVEAASLTLNWNAPTTNADGTPLSDLDGYRVYVAPAAPTCPSSSHFFVASPTSAPGSGDVLSYRIFSLTANATYFVAITAVDLGGLESLCTTPVSAPAQGDITVSPTTAVVDFGTTPVGTAVDMSFTVKNVTTASLAGSASVGSPFSVVSGGSFSLAPGASQPVVVRLLSTAAGTFASNVNFNANGDSVSRTVTGAATAVAQAPPSFTLTVVRAGSGSVSSAPAGILCGSTCTATVTAGTSVALTAVPAPGWTFAGWSGGGCSGTAGCTLSVNSDTTLSGTFTATVTPTARELVVDNAAPGVQDPAGGRTFTGTWCQGSATNEFGADSLRSCGKGGNTYRWTPTIAVSGTYDVYLWIPKSNKGAASVPVTVTYAGGSTVRTFNERRTAGGWVLHGRYPFNAGTAAYVQTDDRSGAAIADAIRLVPLQ